MSTENSLPERLDDLLREVTFLVTGNPQAPARTGQRALAHDILTAMDTTGHVAGLAPTGCICGDAQIAVRRSGIACTMRLEDLVATFEGERAASTFVQRECADGTIRWGRLLAAWSSGEKVTFTVTTESGRSVRATDEHPFLTERGWLKLEQLVPGDLVHVRGSQGSGTDPHALYQATTERVVSVELYGREQTFDLEVADEPHNFLANGFVVHNTGKGFAYLLPAALMAATKGQRTVISTESKALQAQLVDKDLPMVSTALSNIVGSGVSFAIHKGFANYGCALRAHDVAATVGKAQGFAVDVVDSANDDLLGSLTSAGAKLLSVPAGSNATVDLDKTRVPVGALAALAGWVLVEAADGGMADRSDFDGDQVGALWPMVSVSSDECLREACPLFELCPAIASRKRAFESDIVVTNHSLLALQAAMGVPTVLSNSGLGDFHHVVVDEAHTLPSIVRSTGSRSLSGPRLRRVAASLSEFYGSKPGAKDPYGDAIIDTGTKLGDRLESLLATFLLSGRESTRPFDCSKPPVPSDFGAHVGAWRERAVASLPSEGAIHSAKNILKLRRVKSDLNALVTDFATAFDPEEALARWVEVEENRKSGALWHALRFSPVDVSSDIAVNLFSATPIETEQEAQARKALGLRKADVERPRAQLSMTMVSATLPPAFPRESGIHARVVSYASPFDTAYGNSMLYIPRLSGEDQLSHVGSRRPGADTWALDVRRHEQWAAGQIVELVRANGGSALVLASKASSGQLYADALRAAGLGHAVFSQWDGADPRHIVGLWRGDTTSVLVGTRSMMTGVDAAGETCSLVIVDRVPRNPGNVVDDARVQLLMDDDDMSKWVADRAVYASDAALLLEQAAGRLIRRMDDAGMVAVLDPRLMKGTPISYAEATRTVYMRALRRFTARTGDLRVATDFLLGLAAQAA